MVAAFAAQEDKYRRSGTGQGTEMSNRVLNDERHVTILVEVTSAVENRVRHACLHGKLRLRWQGILERLEY